MCLVRAQFPSKRRIRWRKRGGYKDESGPGGPEGAPANGTGPFPPLLSVAVENRRLSAARARHQGLVFTFQALGMLPDPGAPYGFYLESTRGAKCTIGSALSGWSGGFTFYGYHAKDAGEAWYYKPFALVMELR